VCAWLDAEAGDMLPFQKKKAALATATKSKRVTSKLTNFAVVIELL
jgi:hypothetical protein